MRANVPGSVPGSRLQILQGLTRPFCCLRIRVNFDDLLVGFLGLLAVVQFHLQ